MIEICLLMIEIWNSETWNLKFWNSEIYNLTLDGWNLIIDGRNLTIDYEIGQMMIEICSLMIKIWNSEILKSWITDPEFVLAVYKSIKAAFEVQLESGILDVISPPAEFYPNWTNLRQTLGDPLERVQWRSKQNLDYAFLMMYAQWRGTYYVQLEDDILTKANFLATMRDFALGNFDSFHDSFVH